MFLTSLSRFCIIYAALATISDAHAMIKKSKKTKSDYIRPIAAACPSKKTAYPDNQNALHRFVLDMPALSPLAQSERIVALLNAGVNINQQDEFGATPLDYARVKKMFFVCALLIENHAKSGTEL